MAGSLESNKNTNKNIDQKNIKPAGNRDDEKFKKLKKDNCYIAD